jgi:hypothetical protein
VSEFRNLLVDLGEFFAFERRNASTAGNTGFRG